MDPLPDEVKQFTEANIDSVDHLEILRILGENPDKEWLAADVAREAQTPPQAIGAHLAALAGRGLLVVETRGTDLFCRYRPNTPELQKRAAQLLQVYRERPVTMINLVYAKARDALKTFADAFRIRKES